MNKCGVCNKEIPLDHACQNRKEENGKVTSYHFGCDATKLKPCSDCGEHRTFCDECAEY